MPNHIVIMAGGQGTRLYPLSTPEHPKQFIDLLGCGKTMIQLTYERFLRVDPDAVFWIVTGKSYKHFINEQLPDISDSHILLEPEPRNTAPCIAWAVWKILAEDPKSNIIVTPSDAFVSSLDNHAVTLREALDFSASRAPSVVCVGISPTEPHTGYGYIKISSRDEYSEGQDVVKVDSFKEKPDRQTAETYLDEGGYFWNAGIFVFSGASMASEIRTFAPSLAAGMDALSTSFGTQEEATQTALIFPTFEKISIDYAVMEKSQHIYCIPASWPWSDLGSFEAIDAVKAGLGR